MEASLANYIDTLWIQQKFQAIFILTRLEKVIDKAKKKVFKRNAQKQHIHTAV